jgi:hypothetical protein
MGDLVKAEGQAVERAPFTARYVRDGKVAVLVSPGFGAGWSTWCYGDDPQERAWLLFAPELVEAVLDGDTGKAAELAEAHFDGDFYTGGASDLQVYWVDPGVPFLVDEYDGSESLRFTVEAYIP